MPAVRWPGLSKPRRANFIIAPQVAEKVAAKSMDVFDYLDELKQFRDHTAYGQSYHERLTSRGENEKNRRIPALIAAAVGLICDLQEDR